MSDPVEVNGFNGGPTEIDTAVDGFITEFAKEFKAEALNADIEKLDSEVKSTSTDGTDTTETSAAPSTDKPAESPPKESPEDRGVARLVEREVALRTREQELSNREARVAELEARIKQLEGNQAREVNWEDPDEALKSQGQDPDFIVRQIIAKRMGKTDDPQVRQVLENTKVNRRIAELEAKLAEKDRVAAARAFVEQVEAGAREYVTKGMSENTPTVAAVAKANPDRVYREIMEEISKDAAAKTARGAVGESVLSYAEAINRVEARWADLRSYIAPAPAPTPQGNASTKAEAKPAETAPGKTNPPQTTTKPPDRPLAPWLQKSDLEDEGLKAALAEYRRVESGGR